MVIDSKEFSSIIDKIALQHPNPKIELDFVNDYTLLVAIILSAQATDKMVNKVTANIFPYHSTPQAFLELGLENLTLLTRNLNYYKTKSKNIIKMSEVLVDKFNSQPPKTFEELIKLAGVGKKTARVYLANAHKQPMIGVDTHVFRVAKRLGFVPEESTVEQVDKILNDDKNEIKNKHFLNHLLVLHGRYICTAKKPKCDKCLVANACNFYKQNNEKT